jgi:xylulokinase
MSYLGLDIGTSGCKAVVFNMEGKELASAYREYPVTSESKGWAELDSLHTIDCCFDVIRQVNRQLQNDAVEALCISSQGEAFTPVDAAGNIIGNAMISSDARAAELSVSFSHEFGVERLYQITGHTAHPLFTLFKLLWLRNNRPQVWQNAHHFYCFEELMHLKLGIEPAISFPLAGRTMLFDVEKHEWSDEIANAIGLDTDKLARALPSGSYVGTIPATIAASLGFSLPVAVVAGGHDQTCAALGAGVVEPGICMYATGTVECFCPMFDKLTLSDELMNNNLCCYDFTLNGKYTTVAYSLTGGNILKWFRDEFGCTEKQQALASGTDAYSLLLAAMPNEPTNLLVLPYFTFGNALFRYAYSRRYQRNPFEHYPCRNYEGTTRRCGARNAIESGVDGSIGHGYSHLYSYRRRRA